MPSSLPQTLLTSPRLAAAGFAHAFPQRTASDAELLAAVGAPRIVQVKQVHGARVVDAHDAQGQEADALVAGGPGPVAVGVRVADCVPILVGDASTGRVAAIHAGWRGVVGGVIAAGLDRLAGGGDRGGLVAAVGPCIGPCCFEVGREVADAIAAAAAGADVLSRSTSDGSDKAHVDLRAAVRAQLRAAGLADARIEDVAGCTKHEPSRFHSFRRDGANSGRMLAVIAPRK